MEFRFFYFNINSLMWVINVVKVGGGVFRGILVFFIFLGLIGVRGDLEGLGGLVNFSYVSFFCVIWIRRKTNIFVCRV